MLNQMIVSLLQDEKIEEFTIKRQDSEFFTHIVVISNKEKEIFKKILYNEKTNSIFQELHTNEPINKKQKLNMISIADINQIDKDAMIRIVNSALKQCINDHGDITKNWIGSASKRITTCLFNYLNNTKYKIKT